MANRNKNIFAYLDSDDEDVPKTAPKKTETAPPGAPVALNKGPNAGNKKAPKKSAVVETEKKETRAPREPREGGRGAARGGRGGARGGRGGARDFERRSGTGRGKETSKQGGGARNWGNNTDKSELVAEAEVQEGKPEGEEAEAVADEAPVEEEEEEEVQLTLDEYLAKKKESRVGDLFAEKEVRQVTDDFSAAVQITKDGKTPDFIEAQYEKVFTKKTSGRKKQLITDLGFQAAAPERRPFREDREGGRGGRGGRGDREGAPRDGGRDGGRGGRGGDRGRGAPRGGRVTRGRGSAAPNVSDLSAFPSL